MEYPSELRYSSDHEWARLADGKVTIGITDYAQDALGDVVYVDVPEVLHPAAAASVTSHLLKLEREGRAGRGGVGVQGRGRGPGRRQAVAGGERAAADALAELLDNLPVERLAMRGIQTEAQGSDQMAPPNGGILGPTL